MSEIKKYTVIELAEVLNVPRTTVTDWLVRYSSYIEYKVQGKRKIYIEASVNVLKEISELRNKGLSSFDIEEELAKKHPVHGVVSDQMRMEEGENPAEEPDSTGIVLRKSVTEMGETIKKTLMEMSRRIEEVEKLNAENAVRANRWFTLVIVLIVVLIIVGFFAFQKIETSYRENRKLQDESISYLTDLKSAKEQIRSNVLDLTTREKQISALETGLEKQAKEFEEMIARAKKDSDSAKTAEILELRNKFAEEKLNMLRELERSSNEKHKTSGDNLNTEQRQEEAVNKITEKVETPVQE
ncbi:MAG: MerR family transcriptional regulator, partial [Lentisphaerae bacterium]|nr:MerR family transcriptional regulator [Lentisphaerota bacterium]